MKGPKKPPKGKGSLMSVVKGTMKPKGGKC